MLIYDSPVTHTIKQFTYAELRTVLRAMVDNKEYTVPSTIDDPQSLDEIRADLQRRKVGAFAK